MGLKDRTKWMFAEELQKMLKESPLTKIRIGELCLNCNVDRQVFYYHFRDKYDLVAWIFMQDFMTSMKTSGDIPGLFQLAKALTLIKEKKVFYRKSLEDYSQNSLSQYMQEYDVRFYTDILQRKRKNDLLSCELQYSIRYHSYGCIGMTIEWLQNNCDVPPEEFARLLLDHMPEDLKSALLEA